jgi:hypothetical protein
MKKIIEFTDERVPFEKLFLDPNNLRFAHFEFGTKDVPVDRITEPAVQEATFIKLKNSEFQIRSLRDSILEVGFLPVDRIVVSEIDNKNYLVIEGNRRLAALKWVKEMADEGIADKSVLDTFKEINVNVIKPEYDNEVNRLKIQGIRHISEIRPWGTYQKAVLIKSMIDDENLSAHDVANAIGSRTQEVNRVYRAYKLWKQMTEDPDYGEFADTSKITFFYELVGRLPLRKFFGYNEESLLFENEDEYTFFYKWIIEDANNNNIQKIPSSSNVRDLTKIISNGDALRAFKEENTSLEGALAIILKYNIFDWKDEVTKAKEALMKLPMDELENFNDTDRKLLMDLKEIIEKRLIQYDKIRI